MMNKSKKLEKLVLATILAGSMVVGHNALAADDASDYSHIGDPKPLDCNFNGQPFIKANVYANPGGYYITGDSEEAKTYLRDYIDPSEKAALTQGIKYWYSVLGNPKTLPNVDIFLIDEKDSNASASSAIIGDVTALAKCFQESFKKEANSIDAEITVDLSYENKHWYMDNLGILPTNGANDDYSGTIVHEMFHALGVLQAQPCTFTGMEAVIEDPNDFNRYEQHLYDFKGYKFAESNKLAIINNKNEAVEDKTFYLLYNENRSDNDYRYSGMYFKGQHVDEVLNLNGQQALIAWPNDNPLEPVPGIPVNGCEHQKDPDTGILNYFVEFSHFELQNSLQSHQNYRNWCVPMEVELAALEDLGYELDRRRLYGNSIYNSGTEGKPFEYINNNPFAERENGQYIEGKPSSQSWGIGLHVYGSNVKVLQKSNLLADGDDSMGIRVDGSNNKLTIDKDSKVTANGVNGRGINFAYGHSHELNVEGTVTALGAGGKALAFDFGDNEMSNGDDYRGSYLRVSVEEDEDNQKVIVDLLDKDDEDYEINKLTALEGPLANNVNISGNVAGKNAAIYISPNAYVQNINIMKGAQLKGAILSDWSPTGIPEVLGLFINMDGEEESLDLSEDHIHLPEGDDGLTRLNFAGDNLTYKGKIGSAMFESGSFIMNVNSGSLNYEGEASIDSVNVAKGAILQGGTFKLDEKAIHIREGFSKDNSGTLFNQGMISAALPNGSDTVLNIEGTVVNDGGTMAFIGNAGYQGRIAINGALEGDKILAINPNGVYLPGDSYNISDLVTVNGESLKLEDTQPYKNGLLEAVYGNDNKQVTFSIAEGVDADTTKAAEEIGNLGRALAKQGEVNNELLVAELFKMEPAKANKTLKAIKGQQTVNIPAIMQQNNLIRNTLGMRLNQVNRAKAVKLNVPVKQLTKGAAVNVPMNLTVQPEYDLWAKISRNKGAINAESDYKADAYSIGWDKQFNQDWRFGFFGSYAKGKFEAESIYNGLEDYRLGVYGGYNKGAAEAMVYADYGWGRNKLHRTLNGMGMTTKADYDSRLMEVGAEYKYDLQHDKNKAWHVAPYGAMHLNRYSQSSYAETGAAPFNKNVGKLNNTYAGIEAGVDLERRFANGSAYGMRIGYRRGLTGIDPKQNYHYAADPEHRYTNYGEGDKNKLVLRLNGEMQTAPHWTVSCEAGYERGKKGHGYSGEVSLKYTW